MKMETILALIGILTTVGVLIGSLSFIRRKKGSEEMKERKFEASMKNLLQKITKKS